jgi:hypothetical protein
VGTTIPALTGFSTKTQIVNPYALEENDVNILRNGWGITIGACAETPSQEFKYTTVRQIIGIVLTRVVRNTEHNKTPLETATKAMVEDAIAARIDLYNDDQIAIPDNIQLIMFLSRTPVEYIAADGFNIIFTEVSFAFDIREST